MKSIKTIAIIATCAVAFSCNKKEDHSAQADQMDSAQAQTVVDALSHEEASDDALVKEAQSKPLTTLAFAETIFDFGDIKKGDKVQHVYEVTNTGKNPLIISTVKPGCGCTVPDFTKEPILPGQKGKITLHFDSTNFDGRVDKLADVYANVETAPIKLNFTANILP